MKMLCKINFGGYGFKVGRKYLHCLNYSFPLDTEYFDDGKEKTYILQDRLQEIQEEYAPEDSNRTSLILNIAHMILEQDKEGWCDCCSYKKSYIA